MRKNEKIQTDRMVIINLLLFITPHSSASTAYGGSTTTQICKNDLHQGPCKNIYLKKESFSPGLGAYFIFLIIRLLQQDWVADGSLFHLGGDGRRPNQRS